MEGAFGEECARIERTIEMNGERGPSRDESGSVDSPPLGGGQDFRDQFKEVGGSQGVFGAPMTQVEL